MFGVVIVVLVTASVRLASAETMKKRVDGDEEKPREERRRKERIRDSDVVADSERERDKAGSKWEIACDGYCLVGVRHGR